MTLWQRFTNWISRSRATLASIVAGPLPAARATEDAGWDLIASGSGNYLMKNKRVTELKLINFCM